MKRNLMVRLFAIMALVLVLLITILPVTVFATDTNVTTASVWVRFWSLADGAKMTTLVILVLLNLALGIILAVINKNFVLSAVADILKKRVLPFFGGYYLVCLLATADSSYEPLAIGAFIAVTGALTGFVLAKLKELGLPLPDVLAGKKDETKTPPAAA